MIEEGAANVSYLDFRKTFDTVSNNSLLDKLAKYGKESSMMDWKPAERPGPEGCDQWYKVRLEVRQWIDPGANTVPQTSSLMIQKMGQCTPCKFVDDTKLRVTDSDTVVLPFKWTWTGWRIRLGVKSWNSEKLGKNNQCASAFSTGRAPGIPAAVSQKSHFAFPACLSKRVCTQPLQKFSCYCIVSPLAQCL